MSSSCRLWWEHVGLLLHHVGPPPLWLQLSVLHSNSKHAGVSSCERSIQVWTARIAVLTKTWGGHTCTMSQPPTHHTIHGAYMLLLVDAAATSASRPRNKAYYALHPRAVTREEKKGKDAHQSQQRSHPSNIEL